MEGTGEENSTLEVKGMRILVNQACNPQTSN